MVQVHQQHCSSLLFTNPKIGVGSLEPYPYVLLSKHGLHRHRVLGDGHRSINKIQQLQGFHRISIVGWMTINIINILERFDPCT